MVWQWLVQWLLPPALLLSSWLIVLFLILFIRIFTSQRDTRLPQNNDRFKKNGWRSFLFGAHRYLVKLRFGTFEGCFDPRSSVIAVDVRDGHHYHRARFAIYPTLLANRSRPAVTSDKRKTDAGRVVLFQLNLDRRLEHVGWLRITHDTYGGRIFVHSITIQSLDSGRYHQSRVSRYIAAPAPNESRHHQEFACHSGSSDVVSNECWPRRALTKIEWLTVTFFTVNLTCLATVLVIPCFSSDNDNSLTLCSNYGGVPRQSIFWSAIVNSLFGNVIHFFMVTVYRFWIKRRSPGCWLRRLFPPMLFTSGVCIGVVSLGLLYYLNRSVEFAIERWCITFFMAAALHLFVWQFLCLFVAMVSGLFTDKHRWDARKPVVAEEANLGWKKTERKKLKMSLKKADRPGHGV